MRLDIVPEPSAEDRQAILAAFEQALAEPDHRADWWRAGVQENLEESTGEGFSPADE